MIHPDTELRFISDTIGHGVFATRPIRRGTLVWTLCHLDHVFSPDQAAALPEAYHDVLGRYAYVEASGNYVLCWDSGRYINHSCAPAMLGVGREFEIAIRDIAPGEELTCEYGGLNLTGELACHCGAPGCRGRIGARDVLRLCHQWDATVAAMLPHARRVAQPLLAFARDAQLWQDYASGARPVPSHREYFAAQVAAAAGAAGSANAQSQPWAIPGARRSAGGAGR